MTGNERDAARGGDVVGIRTTDALLDRLAAREATRRDCEDPVVTLLASLTCEVDEAFPPVPSLEDLLALVPDPRDGDAPVEDAGAEPPPTRPVPVARGLRGRGLGVPLPGRQGRHSRGEPAEHPSGGVRAVRLSSVAAVAAGVAIAFGVGSLVVGEGPLAPLGRVGEVVSDLNGDQAQQLEEAQELIVQASLAMQDGRTGEAERLLEKARASLRGVEGAEVAEVLADIAEVRASISAESSASPTPSVPSPSASPTSSPQATSTPQVPTPTLPVTPTETPTPTPTVADTPPITPEPGTQEPTPELTPPDEPAAS